MRILKVVASLLLTLAIMVVIFRFSAQNSGDSGSLSDSIARIIATLFVPGFADLQGLEQNEWIAMLSWPVRKTAHASEYGCLAIALFMSCWQARAYIAERKGVHGALPARVIRSAAIAFVLAVLYAISDEMHQLFVDGRVGQVQDVLVDASGAIIGCLLAAFVTYRFLRKRVA